MRARRLLVLTAMVAPSGCSYIAPPDPLALDPDVLFIAIVLAAGENQAHMLAGHPHRPASGAPPMVTASLLGSDWRAAFSPARDQGGCRGGLTHLPFPKICLQALLPEPIREGAGYKLEGKGPKGSFRGETVVPPAPRLLEPMDTVWVPDSIDPIRIPIRYRAAAEVGTLFSQLYARLSNGTGTEWRWFRGALLDVRGERDNVVIYSDDRLIIDQSTLHLLGIGWHYTNFRQLRGDRFPWPNMGVSGEGVYGYFDGSATSDGVLIIVEDSE